MLLSNLFLSMCVLLYAIWFLHSQFHFLFCHELYFCSVLCAIFCFIHVWLESPTIEFGIYFSKKSQSKAPHFLLDGSGTLCTILVLCCLHRPSGGRPTFWPQGMKFNSRNIYSPMLLGSKKILAFDWILTVA